MRKSDSFKQIISQVERGVRHKHLHAQGAFFLF